MKTIIKQAEDVYLERGLNGMYAFLRKNGIMFQKIVYEFGYKNNELAHKKKNDFLKNEMCFHYASRGVRSRRNGYRCNIIRGVEIVIKNKIKK